MTVAIQCSKIDITNWYQEITLVITNEGSGTVDMNHASIRFTGCGYQDPWGNFGGTLKGDMPLTLSSQTQGALDINEMVINHSKALPLAPGESGTLSFSFAAVQIPVKIADFALTLASGSACQGQIMLRFPAMETSTALKPTIDLQFPDARLQRYVGEWGQTLTIGDLSPGTYHITALELSDNTLRIVPQKTDFTLQLTTSDEAQACSITYMSPMPLASVCLNLDVDDFAGTERVVELWSEAGVCEQRLKVGSNQMLWVTQLLAGHDYAVCLQPTVINNQSLVMPAQPAVFTPVVGQTTMVEVAYQQVAVESRDFVVVNVTVLGLPPGASPQRYRLCSGQYQYVFTLNSDPQQQTLPMRLRPGQYTLEVADVTVDGTLWHCEQSAPIRLWQSINHITLEFVSGISR